MSPRSPRRPHLALGLLAGLGGLGLSLSLGPACKVVKTTTIYDTGSADGVGEVDRDGDGFPAVEDCDDEDADCACCCSCDSGGGGAPAALPR
jgi:hypothetical protein